MPEITRTKAADFIPTIWDERLLRRFAPDDKVMAKFFGFGSVKAYLAWLEAEDRSCPECGRPYDDA